MAEFIDKQHTEEFRQLPFGRRGNVADNGCGLIAVCNLLCASGRDTDFLSFYGKYRSRPFLPLCCGRMGVNPFALIGILRAEFGRRRVFLMGRRERPCDGAIFLYLWRRKHVLGAHYAAAIRKADGGYRVYNAPGITACGYTDIRKSLGKNSQLLLMTLAVRF